MRDLHDSLGAKLLAMAQRCRGYKSTEDAREALQILREAVHLSTAVKPPPKFIYFTGGMADGDPGAGGNSGRTIRLAGKRRG